jgi:hypothetical protein
MESHSPAVRLFLEKRDAFYSKYSIRINSSRVYVHCSVLE